jgi:uncharacterized membrane protein
MSEAATRKLPISGKTLGSAVRALFIVIGVSPFLPLVLRGVPVLSALGDLFEAWFAFQCHREPWRSLSVFGHVLPVCSRCTGIYWGLGLGALVLRPRLGVWPLRIWVGLAALVMVLDVWTELLGMRPESAWLRVITGVLLAYPVGSAVVWACRDLDLPPESEAR